MDIRRAFPYEVREIENAWIELADGTRLAARIWLPVGAERAPVPALLEYLPYRKNDGTAVRDSIRHPYLAGHGYACLRVDMRGSGESDGILLDEYLPQEQADALEVLAWIAAQPWCTGRVGIFGKSWGGFNALQIAAHRPPELGAIITIASTDDRYADDVHYMGGCLLAYDMLPWASTMLAYNACPPDPRWVGERWRDMWLRRIEESPPFVETWLTHQRRDDYWRQGSVCEDFAAIDVPVYAVGGWADGYTNAIPRLLAGLSGPRRGLIGPWSHNFPEEGVPGPAIGFLQESLRWWDTWLKGLDTGLTAEPMLISWLQESAPPRPFYPERPGRWVAEPAWPSPHVTPVTLHLADGGRLLPEENPPVAFWKIGGPLAAGLDTQAWCPYGQPGEFAPDQRSIDGQWLTFTAAPAAATQDVLGFPRLALSLAADRPLAQVAVRLCDVAPGGASTLVSWGVLNLTHRHGHDRVEPVGPGEWLDVEITLNAIGQAQLAGHAWRVSLASAYWPQIWPSPEPVTLMVRAGMLTLPVRVPAVSALPPAYFPPAEGAPVLPLEWLREPGVARRQTRDMVTGRVDLFVEYDEGRVRFSDSGLTMDGRVMNRYQIVEGDPLSASVTCVREIAYARKGWDVRLRTESHLTAGATHFFLTNELEAFEGTRRVAYKTWAKTIERDGI